MKEKLNVESFNLDHTKVAAPYVRLAGKTEGVNGDAIYKYDLRFKQPNKAHMDMPSLHSLEHMLAEFSRDHHEGIIDVGPMGCQTGFYMAVMNDESYDNILHVLEKTLEDILKAQEVPACNELQCGWAASHSLEGAQRLAREMLDSKQEWSTIFA